MTKVYRSFDPVPPIVVNLQTTQAGLTPWVLGPVLIAFGCALFWPNNPWIRDANGVVDNSRLFMAIPFGLVLVLAGLSTLSQRIPALARFGTRHRLMLFIVAASCVVGLFGPFLLLLFVPHARLIGMLFAAGFGINFVFIPLWFLQRRNARRIAGEMRSIPGMGAVPVAPISSLEPAQPGELVIELYETNDLPESLPFCERVTAGAGIFGYPPCRFLHLYNFFADVLSTNVRPLAGWRLHGPVLMLASPLELARAAGYKLDLPQSIETKLLLDPAMIAARVAAMNDDPLPPLPTQRESWLARRLSGYRHRLASWVGTAPVPTLPPLFASSGAYPEEVLLCTDQSWQQGVQAITERAHKAIMDASDFSCERHGLVWEIQHILNHFATEDFVILVNSFCDFPALCKEFRRAWNNMAATSPNNRPGEGRLRVVLLFGDDRGGWDDDNSLGGRSVEVRDWERVAAHNRIVTMLCGDRFTQPRANPVSS